ncbi:Kelch repeat-containing protein [Amycolatopsis sp. NPDC088138]|uniref:Kelch repeat-containing protein n=1 Tax=Amycolatopsis sp. NPDC088138 TaxID=3363938 RepID=UPI0038172CCB
MSKPWKDRPPLHTGRFAHDVATTGGQIYVIGGVAVTGFLGSVETRRVHGDGEWHDVAPMHTPRGNHAVGVLDGMIYAIGGIVQGEPDDQGTAVVERYDPDDDQWTTCRPLPAARGATSAASLDGVLYVAGGVLDKDNPDDNEHATDSVLAFDPQADRWTPVASMLSPRARHRLVAAGGHLYAIGGALSRIQEAYRTVERYSPNSDRWEAVRSMHQPRGVPAATVLTNGPETRIVVVGGGPGPASDRLARHRTTEVFDVHSGKWELLSTLLPHGTAAFGCARESGNKVLAIGGSPVIDGAPTITSDVLALKVPHTG